MTQINGVLKEEGGKQTDQDHPGAPRLHSLPVPPRSAALLSQITADLWNHLLVQRFDCCGGVKSSLMQDVWFVGMFCGF